jgi:hypothetical protein
MSLSAGDKLGHYEIVSMPGKGGMGEVWKAHDPRLGLPGKRPSAIAKPGALRQVLPGLAAFAGAARRTCFSARSRLVDLTLCNSSLREL